MARIAVGGWQHETNTFATIKADYEAFAGADEWPPLVRGEEMVGAVKDVHLPVAGALKAISECGHEAVPLLWCSATPCSYVTEEAFEQISSQMLASLEAALPVDGIYLDLHGAMVCEHHQDGEGEILRRIRHSVGDGIPIFVSLDLHANVTPQMVEYASVLDIYRTYPHIDMGETGYRVAKYLDQHLKSSEKIYKAFRQVDFLIPLNTGCTLIEPCQSLYQSLPNMITGGVDSLSFACGFHLSDIYHVGPAVVGYGGDEDAVNSAVEDFTKQITESQAQFYEKIWSVDEGISEALDYVNQHSGPVVVADTQDNPGGGGAGDTIGILDSLLRHGASNALLGVINDPVVAELAHQGGVGAQIEFEIGGKAGIPGQPTLHCTAKVINLSDGRFTATGPMYKGANMELGLTALLDVKGILVVVCCKAVQTADQAHFRHLGVEPETMDLVVVKSSVHFRNDFDEFAARIMILSSPGEVYADPSKLKYKNIRRDITITAMA